MHLRDFDSCTTVEDFLKVANGTTRLAEAAAWALWYESGPAHSRNPAFAQMAVAIADTKYAGQH